MEPNTPPRVPETQPAAADPQPYKSNPDVDARIDAYIKDNPRHWDYIRALPRDRLERTVVLHEVRLLERQQRTRDNVLKRIDRDPGLKQAYDTLVKHLPEDQKENVIAQLARTTQRVVARSAGQQSQGVGI